MTIRFLSEAESELVEAENWYANNNEGVAARFIDEIERGLALIEERPLAWRLVDDNVRQFRLWRFPYGIVYRITDSGVLVLAVAHLHRKPRYWGDRR
jgi:plasmid stabilization system protein ParE